VSRPSVAAPVTACALPEACQHQEDAMKSQQTLRFVALLGLVALMGVVALFVVPSTARPQTSDQPPALDHLKCYTIKDSLQPAKFQADLRNQFGLEKGCVIALPARLLCVETDKRITSAEVPPGGGPSGRPAGHFLCYSVRCPDSENPFKVPVQDQFGTRRIAVDRARLLCAPANKLICGDGDLDPGEQCDPGSAATNVCPGGEPCNADCTCPVPICCDCGPNGCSDATAAGCPPGCPPVSGVACTANGTCEECPCGARCLDADGNVGACRPTGSAATDPCECVVEPPPECPCGVNCTTDSGITGFCRPVAGSDVCRCVEGPPPVICPCGTDCTTAAGEVGFCRPDPATNQCTCRPVPPPPDCPCGTTCVDVNGQAGLCRPVPGSNACACVTIPPPPQCPCGTDCTTAAGEAGSCRPDPTTNQCTCRPVPPPPDCPCGATCVDANNQAGVCRPVPGADACACVAIPPPPECVCGKSCTTSAGLSGHCRPVNGTPGVCACTQDQIPGRSSRH